MNELINAVIIDDEDTFSSALEIILSKNFLNIKILGSANSVAAGITLINETKPNLVFLDINMPDGTGFDLLDQAGNKDFETIFTTSFSEFAFRAFEFSALHYLMKPITLDNLKNAMERYAKLHSKDRFDEKLRILKESLLDKPQKILLPSSDGQYVVNISDIVRCEAAANYANVYFIDKKHQLISRPLQNLDRILNDLNFVRIHSKHLVNLRFVKKYVGGRTPYVILTDLSEIPISQSQKSDFANRLKHFAMSL